MPTPRPLFMLVAVLTAASAASAQPRGATLAWRVTETAAASSAVPPTTAPSPSPSPAAGAADSELVSIDAAGVTLRPFSSAPDRADAPTRTIPLTGIIRLERVTDRSANRTADLAPRATSSFLLVQRDGQVLPGRVVPGDAATDPGESVAWKHPLLGVVSVRLQNVAALRRSDAAPVSLPATPATEDTVILLNGDIQHGVVSALSDANLTLTPPAGGDPITLQWQSVREVLLADLSGKARPLPSPGWQLSLLDGTVLRTPTLQLDGPTATFTATGPAGKPVAIPAAYVHDIENAGLSAWSLSTLRPQKTEVHPYFSVTRPPVYDAAIDGSTLTLAGQPVSRGLALTSFTRLTWPVPEGFTRLRLTVAPDPSMQVGSATLRITTGDAAARSVSVQPGAAPVPVELPLEGAKSLVIECDFGNSGGVQSRVLLLDPLLLR